MVANDDETNSIIADGGATGSRLPGGTSVGDLPTSSVSATARPSWSLNKRVLRERTP